MRITIIILTSFKIFFMYGAMQEGEVLHPLRCLLERFLDLFPVQVKLYLKKPLYDCPFCMSSVWGFIFTIKYASFTIDYLFMMLEWAGLNFLLTKLVSFLTDYIEILNERKDSMAEK